MLTVRVVCMLLQCSRATVHNFARACWKSSRLPRSWDTPA